ncbi:cache domain-containing protein [Rhodoferax sp.]|uniref:sensor histidine kinase n=2 Tax=Rhodoferax sp. TaxID=50421 RepID=UPI00271A606F|nr:cache domain-containing protein [Rhodoferax sp.]MDO9145202.1 cache domain-containing protein [Rhodoferax sp.]MDP1528959.1 cache domain-containing protein [Rhodoferax sp.]
MSAQGLRLRWQHLPVRHKLMVLSLLPLLVVLPLLVAALVLWGSSAYDRLLITKVRSDLAVAHGYFGRVLAEVGTGTQALANAHTLHLALAAQQPEALQRELAQARQRLGFDFVNLYTLDGQLHSASWQDPASATLNAAPAMAQLDLTDAGQPASVNAQLQLLSQAKVLALAPHLAPRLSITLIPTQGAVPSNRSQEDQALVMLASHAVTDAQGQPLAWLRAGVLLNQNLALIDHINHIVYPEGSLPLGSVGTATLFLDDVRITTNVRLFQDQRAIGTRVSQAVREAVLVRGETWLDRAFVVNDWYVSAYEPLLNGQGARVGMLYVGYLETPFRQTKYGILAIIVGIFAVAMVLAAWLSLRWARSIFQPLERMSHTMQQVQDGDVAARVGPLPQQDELGALASHLDQLLTAVDDKTRTLQHWAQELDAKVTERTRDLAASHESLKLTQAQLVKSEKLAAIGQLTASVAHEINNPIAVMQGNLDLVRETLGSQALPIGPELKLMDQQIERMRLIVTQLLQYARPNDYAGYVEAVDVNDALASSLVLVEHLLNRTHIKVQRQWQASRPVHINRQELQQVLINLLINAIQAMPEGGELLLRTSDQTDAQGLAGVRIEVCDTGAGLSPANLEQLFSPFYTTKNDGNGLGLWISVGLVERYGGSIRAGNRRDQGEDLPGAVFTVDLL